MTVHSLKRYAYSACILVVMVSMATVLFFGSPIFDLSPNIITFDRILYPILIVLGILAIRGILSDRIPIQKIEKPAILSAVIFFFTKFNITIFTAPHFLPVSYVESWYWMLLGICAGTFLAFTFIPALLINVCMYILAVISIFTNIVLKSPTIDRVDHISDMIASNFRLGFAAILIIILGYIKHQWTVVEQEAMKLRDIAHVDELTKLANRRYLNNFLQQTMKSTKKNVTIIMFDLDGFKEINDRFGHVVGDDVLRSIGNIVTKYARPDDTVGRWGGEEFLIICPNTNLEHGLFQAEQIRQAIVSHWSNEARRLSITGSFGVAQRQPKDTPHQLIARVDKALYQAKTRGKNRVYPSPASR